MRNMNGCPRSSLDDRSIIDLVRDLRDDAEQLLRQELKLLSIELRSSARKVAANSITLGSGVLTVFLALQVLVATVGIAVTVGLAQFMPMTAAIIVGPFIVTIMLGVAAFVAVRTGIQKLRSTDIVPRRTVESIKETRQWLTENTNQM